MVNLDINKVQLAAIDLTDRSLEHFSYYLDNEQLSFAVSTLDLEINEVIYNKVLGYIFKTLSEDIQLELEVKQKCLEKSIGRFFKTPEMPANSVINLKFNSVIENVVFSENDIEEYFNEVFSVISKKYQNSLQVLGVELRAKPNNKIKFKSK